jgi:hypothetical protein
LFCFVFVYVPVGKSAKQSEAIQIKADLHTTTTERQTHTRSLSSGKSAGIVSSDLSRACGIGQIARVVHGVTIRNVVLGARYSGDCRDSALRREGATGRHVGVESGELCGSRKVEVQRHFII